MTLDSNTLTGRRRPRRTVVAALAVALAVLGAGCSATAAPVSSTPGRAAGGPPAATPAGRTHYPLTVHDCNGLHTYDHAPSRIVTLDDSATDTLVALGLTSRIVAVTKYETPSQEWSQDASVVAKLRPLSLPNLNAYPSLESILAVRPDVVISDFPSAFEQGSGPATPARWASLGVASYETLADCGMYTATPQYDFSVLYTDIQTLGVIFDVQAAAARLIAHLRAEVAADQTLAKNAGLGSYRIGEADGMRSSAGTLGVTTANAIITEAGSTYAYVKDDTNPNAGVSWEQVVSTNPQVIWVITDLSFTAAQAEHFLLTDPQLRTVQAVRNQAFIPLSYFAASGSPRAVDAVRLMVEGLIQLKHEGKLPSAA